MRSLTNTGLNNTSNGNILNSGVISGVNYVTNNLTNLQDKIASGFNAQPNTGINISTPNLATLQNQITTPNVLNTLQNTLTSNPNTGSNNIYNASNQIGEINAFLDNMR